MGLFLWHGYDPQTGTNTSYLCLSDYILSGDKHSELSMVQYEWSNVPLSGIRKIFFSLSCLNRERSALTDNFSRFTVSETQDSSEKARWTCLGALSPPDKVWLVPHVGTTTLSIFQWISKGKRDSDTLLTPLFSLRGSRDLRSRAARKSTFEISLHMCGVWSRWQHRVNGDTSSQESGLIFYWLASGMCVTLVSLVDS